MHASPTRGPQCAFFGVLGWTSREARNSFIISGTFLPRVPGAPSVGVLGWLDYDSFAGRPWRCRRNIPMLKV